MTQFAFGSGSFYGVLGVANATPVKFGGVQSISVDFSSSIKNLFGQYQFPIAVGRSSTAITGKANFAQLVGRLVNDLFFSGTLAAGQLSLVENESGTIPGTPYQITVSGGANFVTDLGVRNATTGIPLTRVASAPATGQYSVNIATGVYTFASVDTGNSVYISYTKNVASTGQKLTISNPLMGAANAFLGVFTQAFNGLYTTLQLNQCMSTKLTYATQLEDFVKPEFDFGAFADSSNTIGIWSFAEAS